MKLILIIISLCFPFLPQGSSIYSITFKSLDNLQLDMAAYQGKKILIAEFNGADPDLGLLTYLDSLERSDNLLQVIAIPALDFGNAIDEQALKNLQFSSRLSIVLAKPGYVKKNKSVNQHPLLKWLTTAEENTCFDYDAATENQLFLVSKKGTLYGIVNKGTSRETMDFVITKPYDE